MNSWNYFFANIKINLDESKNNLQFETILSYVRPYKNVYL